MWIAYDILKADGTPETKKIGVQFAVEFDKYTKEVRFTLFSGDKVCFKLPESSSVCDFIQSDFYAKGQADLTRQGFNLQYLGLYSELHR